MAYSEARKKYANRWYLENKERLKNQQHRKVAKAISDKKYYEKNRSKIIIKAKEWRQKNLELTKIQKKKKYEENKQSILANKKEMRKSEAYKAYMKEYRKKNKTRISQQEKIKGREWTKKQVDIISDSYIITLLCNSKVGIFKTHAEARKHPELIELKRSQILISRIKKQIKLKQNGKKDC